MSTLSHENSISKDKNLLIVLGAEEALHAEIRALIHDFCGQVARSVDEIPDQLVGKRVFACGELTMLPALDCPVRVITDCATGLDGLQAGKWEPVDLGQVPVLVHNAGVYYRRMFFGADYFARIRSEHAFQSLTESTKDSKALRKGIYLAQVTQAPTAGDADALHFHLLRCSSNLSGPTDNFRATDHHILDTLNAAIRHDFTLPTELNHVLAQIYENKKTSDGHAKEVKSKIKAHSDKTKDMPPEGLIAFTTFYDFSQCGPLKPSGTDPYDRCHKQVSALTKLHFRLKTTVQAPTLPKEFSVTLYPDSTFIIPLSTNRLYTHEIKPSILPVDQIPVRLGYVARCSNLEAMHIDGQTYIQEDGRLIPLQPMTHEAMGDLRKSYYEENTSEAKVAYGKVHFSMNAGDYERPIL